MRARIDCSVFWGLGLNVLMCVRRESHELLFFSFIHFHVNKIFLSPIRLRFG